MSDHNIIDAVDLSRKHPAVSDNIIEAADRFLDGTIAKAEALSVSFEDLLSEAQALTRRSPHEDIRGVIDRTVGARLDPMAEGFIRQAIRDNTGQKAKDIEDTFKQARRRDARAVGPTRTWMNQCILEATSLEPKPILANAVIAFQEDPDWRGRLGFNEFTGWIVLRNRPPWLSDEEPFREGPWTDADTRRATVWLQNAGIHAGSKTVFEAITAVAEEDPFHPVKIYLNSLGWDGTERLDDWLFTYAGVDVEDSDNNERIYLQAIGARGLIGAVARIYQPGAKVDSALILLGDQDLLKSRVFAIIGGDWFTDQIPDLKTKDAAIQLAGVWIIEFAELTSFRSAETNTVKSFMSRQKDRYRAPYGTQASDHPRQNAFGGTTNDEEFLHDPTGARRFWTARTVRRADVDALARDRDQLLAEAVHRYRQGEEWWLHEKELIDAAADVADEHYAADPWEQAIAEWIDCSNKQVISIGEVLQNAIGKKVEQWDRRDQTRVGVILRNRLRWKKKQARAGDLRGRRFYLRPGVWELHGQKWVDLVEPTRINEPM